MAAAIVLAVSVWAAVESFVESDFTVFDVNKEDEEVPMVFFTSIVDSDDDESSYDGSSDSTFVEEDSHISWATAFEEEVVVDKDRVSYAKELFFEDALYNLFEAPLLDLPIFGGQLPLFEASLPDAPVVGAPLTDTIVPEVPVINPPSADVDIPTTPTPAPVPVKRTRPVAHKIVTPQPPPLYYPPLQPERSISSLIIDIGLCCWMHLTSPALSSLFAPGLRDLSLI